MSEWNEAKAERQRIRRAIRKVNPRPGDDEAQKKRNSKRWHTKRKFDIEYRKNRVQGTKERRKIKAPASYVKIGATLDDFERFWAKQKGKCGICKKSLKRSPRPHLDHCHTTGKLRGLLCYSCNTKLGWFEKYYDQACDYLEWE